MEPLFFHNQVIHLKFEIGGNSLWPLSIIYDSPQVINCNHFWDALAHINDIYICAWLVTSEFNALLLPLEKRKGAILSKND